MQHTELTLYETATYCGLHPNTIYRALRTGELDGIKRRTGWLIPKSAVEAYLKKRDTDVRICSGSDQHE